MISSVTEMMPRWSALSPTRSKRLEGKPLHHEVPKPTQQLTSTPFCRILAAVVSLVAAAACLALAAGCRASDTTAYDLRSETPLTYVRDYSGGHLDDEAFLEAIAANTPELLVLGKDAPIHHNWGPVAGTGGENQAFGQGAAIRRLSPEELRMKMGKIRAMTNQLHSMGVKWVMPYICTMTIAGDPDKRTGFWEFYDHWDDYTGFGLGPRPKEDPFDWMQRRADGNIQTYYPPDADYYAPNRRWAACIQHPGWRRHLGNVVRLAAETGYDGVYMDNNRSTRCHCDECQKAFREYIARRLTPEEIKRDLGADRLEDVHLDPNADPYMLEALNTADDASGDPRLSPKADIYLTKLTWEFWTDSKIDFLRELKAIGEKARGGEFHIFANTTAWTKGAYEIARVSTVASFNQLEENGGAAGAHPGLVPPELAEGGSGPAYNRRAFEYKFNQSVCNGMRAGMLTRSGHGLDDAVERAIDQNPQTASLSIAESAAYGGGGGYKMQLRWDEHHAVRLWRDFIEKHPDLYEGGEIWAPVGVIAFAEQFYCGIDKTHQEALKKLSSDLLANDVLFDMVHEANFSLEKLRRFRAVIVPAGVRSLSDAQWETFRCYAREGHGALIVMGENFATMDEKCRPRSASQRIPEGSSALPAAVPIGALMETLSKSIHHPCAALTDANGNVPQGVGVNAYIASSNGGPGKILFHLVNYNVPLGEDRTDPPRPVIDLAASVPLPPGWNVASVEAFSPYSDENLDVKFKQTGEGVRLEIPRLYQYQVIRILGGKIQP